MNILEATTKALKIVSAVMYNFDNPVFMAEWISYTGDGGAVHEMSKELADYLDESVVTEDVKVIADCLVPAMLLYTQKVDNNSVNLGDKTLTILNDKDK